MTKLISLILLCGTAALAQAAPVPQMPHAVKVCDELGTITASSATLPVTIQFGIGSTWDAPVVVTGSVLPLSIVYTNPVLGGDPLPFSVKELDVQEQASAYTVTCVNASGASSVVNVPALAVVPPPVTTPPAAGPTPISVPTWPKAPVNNCWASNVMPYVDAAGNTTKWVLNICAVP